MRWFRLALLLLLAAACGGKDDAAPTQTQPAAPTEPLVDGKTVAAWCTDLESAPTARAAAMTLAGVGAGDARVLPALGKALAHPDPAVRRAAIDALGRVGEPAVAPTALLLDAADAATRDAAGDALAKIGQPGLGRLVVALGEKRDRVPAAAAAALQRAGDVAVTPLADGLAFGSASVRVPAAKCLAALNAADALVAALADASTRDAAADALASMGAAAMPALQAAASDAKTAAAANDVLVRIRTGGASAIVKALADSATRAKSAADLAVMGDAAVPALVAGLSGDSDPLRAACADVLASGKFPCAKELAPLLDDARPAVRTAAANVLVRLGADGTEPLVEALGGPDAEKRERVLAAIRAAHEAGLAVLAAAIDRGDDAARDAARREIVNWGAAAVPLLEDILVRGNPAARDAAIAALAGIGAPAVPALARLVASGDGAVRDAAADALGGIGEPALPALLTALGMPNPATQAAAMRGLTRAGGVAVPALIALLKGPDAALAERAAQALGNLGPAAVPELTKFASAPDSVTRAAVADALGKAAATTDAAVPPLAVLLGDAETEVRIAAARGLATAGPRAKSASKEIAAAMRDKVAQVRVLAAVASAKSGGDAAAALTCVTAELKQKDAGVRLSAVTALPHLGLQKPQVVPLLVAAAKDADVHVRIVAIESLVAVGAKSDDVVEAIGRCAASADPAERNAALIAMPFVTDTPVAEAAHFGGPMRGDRVRRRQLAALGGNPQTEAAVAAALDWLARHQSPDGSWSVMRFTAQCRNDHCGGDTQYDGLSPGASALSLLAFLGAGETPVSGPHKDTVARGVAYLDSIMDSEGCVGPRSDNHFMYNHAVATVALCETYMLTGDPAAESVARRAVAFALKAKNPYLAWRYNYPPDGDNDTSITGWMCWALATARAACIEPDECKLALKDAVSWVEKMTEPEFGRTGYQERGGSPSRQKGIEDRFPNDKSDSLTAIGMMVRVFAGHTPKDDEFLLKGADLLKKKPPRWDVDSGAMDFYYWFWGSCAMRQVGGASWKSWSDSLKIALLANQRRETERCSRGSWDTVDAWSGAAGRIYSTAMCCLCLESYWRTDRLLPETK